jgi:hypothetical protein
MVQRYERSFWSNLFWADHENSSSGDDMLFFVNDREQNDEGFTEVGSELYFVRRKGTPLLLDRVSPGIDWEATFYLNAICNRLQYILIVTSRAKTASGSVIITKETRQIYATPHALEMQDSQSKSEAASHAYPTISFQVKGAAGFCQASSLDTLFPGPPKHATVHTEQKD